MKIKSYYFLSLLLLFGCKYEEKSGFFVKDVSDPIINLDGEWKLCLNPSENFYLGEQQAGEWKSVQVPGEAMMQGFPVKYDEPFAYMKRFVVPEDYEGKKIFIRFEGVYSYARVWINGEFLRDHHGGFTAWDCDVTPYVTAGEEAVLMIEVTDRSDDISYASVYAKHPIGGILRSVSLMALPISYPEDIVITTTLDEQFKNGILGIKGTMSGEIAGTSINIELVSPLNQNVVLKNKSLVLDDSEFEIINEIQDIMKWNAEHPNLYRMKISLLKDSKIVWSKWYNVGFREVQIEGNILKVNGKPVKLRGANRHDMHPLLGRVSTREYDLLDVLLAKEANINFIRTSHYPSSDYFLDLCDQYGIYVVVEAAICFLGRISDFLPDNIVNDTAYTQRFLSAVGEMIVNLRHHPSIITWSIGNESKYGYNILKSFQLAKELDNRPVIFSYPGNVPDSVYSYDIVSAHYPNLTGFQEGSGYRVDSFYDPYKPVLFDEWLHVSAYNKHTLLQDQNVRSFWGMSIDTMWQRCFDTDGCLGGAIWGMIDETFMMPLELPGYDEWWGKNIQHTLPGVYAGRVIGYGEWGIVDTWRRKKPEFWNTKKGYSPVRVLKEIYDDYEEGSAIKIPVYNRFDFTNLNEITIKYTYKGKSFTAVSPDIPEHSKGEIEISLNNWEINEPLLVEFFDKKNQLIDNYELLKNEPEIKIDPPQSGGQIDLTEDETNYIMVTDEGLKILLNKSTGMISYFRQESDNMLLQGPYINFLTRGRRTAFMQYAITSYEKNWSFIDLSVSKKDEFVSITINGRHPDFKDVSFIISVYPDGSLQTTYSYAEVPPGLIHELGVSFNTAEDADSLYWKTKGYWSVYPDDHLSAKEGKVSLYSDVNNLYREKPMKEWQYDTKSFYYEGTAAEEKGALTYISSATKEYFFTYSLNLSQGGSITLNGDGSQSARIRKDENGLVLYVNDILDYPGLMWGNYQKNISLTGSFEGKVNMKIKRN